jgi:pyrroline-5-carboxylate reductase
MEGLSMIGFIGGGNMAEAIIKGILKSSKFKPSDIIVSDISTNRIEYLREKYKITVTNSNEVVLDKSNTVILAVKPQVIDNVLQNVKSSFTMEHLVISIAAGVTISRIEGILGADKKIVRVMPNACAFVLESMSVLSFNKNINDNEKVKALTIFKEIGEALELDESYMDAVTALSGSGPGFIASILEAFSDAAVNIGLPRDIADKLIVQTFKGTIKLAEQTGKSFIEIKNMVTSPGGTTIKGILALERGKIKHSIMDCVESAYFRSKEL